jgi:ABC-2 type transport system permease protein
MSGLGAFLAKEFHEIRKTWRLWVIPGILVFFGIASPILAAATPALVKATAQRSPGVILHFPPPVARDAYAQYLGNLAQVGLLAIIVTGAAVVAGERRAGTAVLMLTKPLSRAGFIVAKTVSNLALVTAATVLGAALCIVTTILLFDADFMGRFAASISLWLALAAMFVALMVLLSAAVGRQAPAAGIGIGVYVGLALLAAFPAVRDHTPAGLLAASDALLKGKDVALLWPLLTTGVVGALCVIVAAALFRRKEL